MEANYRLENESQSEEEEEEEENEDVESLLKRYKERILFMSRDVQPVVICAAIKLIDCMRRRISCSVVNSRKRTDFSGGRRVHL